MKIPNKQKIAILISVTRILRTVSAFFGIAAVAVLLMAMPSNSSGQGLAELKAVEQLSGALANTIDKDTTRLALQVSIVSILSNLLIFGAYLRLSNKYAEKPCAMTSDSTTAIMRDMAAKALEYAKAEARDRDRVSREYADAVRAQDSYQGIEQSRN